MLINSYIWPCTVPQAEEPLHNVLQVSQGSACVRYYEPLYSTQMFYITGFMSVYS